MSRSPPPLPPPGPMQLNYVPPQYAGRQYAPCFRCGCTYADQVGFTWWGGLIGSKVLTHVRCRNCGTCYNGKSGKSNTGNIILYQVVCFVVFGAIFGVLFLLLFTVL